MKKLLLVAFFISTILSCQTRVETQFSEDALNDQLVSLNGDSILFKTILENHKGKTIFRDIWAS